MVVGEQLHLRGQTPAKRSYIGQAPELTSRAAAIRRVRHALALRSTSLSRDHGRAGLENLTLPKFRCIAITRMCVEHPYGMQRVTQGHPVGAHAHDQEEESGNCPSLNVHHRPTRSTRACEDPGCTCTHCHTRAERA